MPSVDLAGFFKDYYLASALSVLEADNFMKPGFVQILESAGI